MDLVPFWYERFGRFMHPGADHISKAQEALTCVKPHAEEGKSPMRLASGCLSLITQDKTVLFGALRPCKPLPNWFTIQPAKGHDFQGLRRHLVESPPDGPFIFSIYAKRNSFSDHRISTSGRMYLLEKDDQGLNPAQVVAAVQALSPFPWKTITDTARLWANYGCGHDKAADGLREAERKTPGVTAAVQTLPPLDSPGAAIAFSFLKHRPKEAA